MTPVLLIKRKFSIPEHEPSSTPDIGDATDSIAVKFLSFWDGELLVRARGFCSVCATQNDKMVSFSREKHVRGSTCSLLSYGRPFDWHFSICTEVAKITGRMILKSLVVGGFISALFCCFMYNIMLSVSFSSCRIVLFAGHTLSNHLTKSRALHRGRRPPSRAHLRRQGIQK